MAIPTSDLQTLRDNLIKARSNGLREVRDSDGSTITYPSDSEMAAKIASLNAQIADAGRAAPVKDIRFNTSKGL